MFVYVPQKENKAKKALDTVDAISNLSEAKVVLKKIIEHVFEMHKDIKRLKSQLKLIKENVD